MNNATGAEQKLWSILRNRQMAVFITPFIPLILRGKLLEKLNYYSPLAGGS